MTTDLEQAQHKLAGHGGFTWLLETQQVFWSVNQVVSALTSLGMQVSEDTVTRWFHTLPHTQFLAGRGGLRASRNDLIILFASQMGPDSKQRRRSS